MKWLRRFTRLSVLASLLALAVATVARAASVGQEAVEVLPLPSVFELLAQGIGVGAVLAFLFERFKWFQGLTGDARWWVVFGFSLGLPLIAQLLLQFVPAEAWAIVEPYWRALAAGFLAWAASQGAHMLQKVAEARSFRVIG